MITQIILLIVNKLCLEIATKIVLLYFWSQTYFLVPAKTEEILTETFSSEFKGRLHTDSNNFFDLIIKWPKKIWQKFGFNNWKITKSSLFLPNWNIGNQCRDYFLLNLRLFFCPLDSLDVNQIWFEIKQMPLSYPDNEEQQLA